MRHTGSTNATAQASAACDVSLKSVGTRTRWANVAIRHSAPSCRERSGMRHLVRQLTHPEGEQQLRAP